MRRGTEGQESGVPFTQTGITEDQPSGGRPRAALQKDSQRCSVSRVLGVQVVRTEVGAQDSNPGGLRHWSREECSRWGCSANEQAAQTAEQANTRA